jgi:hypothetical protein
MSVSVVRTFLFGGLLAQYKTFLLLHLGIRKAWEEFTQVVITKIENFVIPGVGIFFYQGLDEKSRDEMCEELNYLHLDNYHSEPLSFGGRTEIVRIRGV